MQKLDRTSYQNRERLIKILRQRKGRFFKRRRVYDLEEANIKVPNEFWKRIRNLGPKGKSGIPWEVMDNTV